MGEAFRFLSHIHKLEEANRGEKFKCSECKVKGSGVRYRCSKPCNFNSHSFCAACPLLLSSSVHEHEVKLLHASQMRTSYCCDICRQEIQGIFYQCVENCNFDAHPLCIKDSITHQPLLTASAHEHELKLLDAAISSSNYCCDICGHNIQGTFYHCAENCDFDVHVLCIERNTTYQPPETPKPLLVTAPRPLLVTAPKPLLLPPSQEVSKPNQLRSIPFQPPSQEPLKTNQSQSIPLQHPHSPGQVPVDVLLPYPNRKLPTENCNFDAPPACFGDKVMDQLRLTSSMHKHELELLDTAIMPSSYCCDICGDKIQGTFYHCTENCDFDVHHLCIKGNITEPPPPPPRASELSLTRTPESPPATVREPPPRRTLESPPTTPELPPSTTLEPPPRKTLEPPPMTTLELQPATATEPPQMTAPDSPPATRLEPPKTNQSRSVSFPPLSQEPWKTNQPRSISWQGPPHSSGRHVPEGVPYYHPGAYPHCTENYNFDAHPLCTKDGIIDEPILTSSLHKHKLKLLDTTIMPSSYCCDICGHKIQGTFYHCMENCNFDVHPHCIKGNITNQSSQTPEPPLMTALKPPPLQQPLVTNQSRSIHWQHPYSPIQVPVGVPYDYHICACPHCPNYRPNHVGSPHNGVPFAQAQGNTNDVGVPHNGVPFSQAQGSNIDPNEQGKKKKGRGSWPVSFIGDVAAGVVSNMIAEGVSNLITEE